MVTPTCSDLIGHGYDPACCPGCHQADEVALHGPVADGYHFALCCTAAGWLKTQPSSPALVEEIVEEVRGRLREDRGDDGSDELE